MIAKTKKMKISSQEFAAIEDNVEVTIIYPLFLKLFSGFRVLYIVSYRSIQ